MNEDEAKTKDCVIVGIISAFMAGKPGWEKEKGVNGSLANCIGSQCMMFRWSYPPEEAKGNKNGPLGYCGLAGKP